MSRIAKQKNRIIAYIEKYGSITVKEAQDNLGIGDPRKRISELRAEGEYLYRTNGKTVKIALESTVGISVIT